MIKVAIESPFAGDVERNKRYAHFCARDCLRRGENPYASHLFFTQFLDDVDPKQREVGIQAGLEWAALAQKRVVYTDLGVSGGMLLGIEHAKELGQEIEYRQFTSDLFREFEEGCSR